MIHKIHKDYVIHECDCGARNEVSYKDIKYIGKDKLPQFVFPICKECKSRIEFIFINSSMTEIQLRLLAKMSEEGLM